MLGRKKHQTRPLDRGISFGSKLSEPQRYHQGGASQPASTSGKKKVMMRSQTVGERSPRAQAENQNSRKTEKPAPVATEDLAGLHEDVSATSDEKPSKWTNHQIDERLRPGLGLISEDLQLESQLSPQALDQYGSFHEVPSDHRWEQSGLAAWQKKQSSQTQADPSGLGPFLLIPPLPAVVGQTTPLTAPSPQRLRSKTHSDQLPRRPGTTGTQTRPARQPDLRRPSSSSHDHRSAFGMVPRSTAKDESSFRFGAGTTGPRRSSFGNRDQQELRHSVLLSGPQFGW